MELQQLYDPLHGKPAKSLAERISGVGLVIGEGIIEVMANDHLISVDEVIYFAVQVHHLYKSVEVMVREGIKQTKAIPAERWKNPEGFKTPLSVLTGVWEKYGLDRRKSHMLSESDKVIESIFARLKLFELNGYASAKFVGQELNRAREAYMRAVEDGRAFLKKKRDEVEAEQVK